MSYNCKYSYDNVTNAIADISNISTYRAENLIRLNNLLDDLRVEKMNVMFLYGSDDCGQDYDELYSCYFLIMGYIDMVKERINNFCEIHQIEECDSASIMKLLWLELEEKLVFGD